MKIAVAGATGRVGRHVVEVLEAQGHDVVPISRSSGVDVITGEGLAAALAGVECIIGTERFAGGYGAAKVAHEQATLAGPIPVSVLRAAQFHEFVEQLVGWGTQGEVSYVQEMRTRPVAARTVAEALADLATAPSALPMSAIAGPREESLVELARLFVARRDVPVKIEGVSDPADPDARLSESGGLLPGPDAALAGPTFEEWLDTT